MITGELSISKMVETIIETDRVPLKQIAEEIGVTTMTLYRWKKGLSVPKSQAMINALTSYANRE
jgi:phage portal protein BeeE